MNVSRESMRLYVVTDRSWLHGKSLESQVELILQQGATFLQLREKELPFEDFVQEARVIKKLTDRYHIPFVINDNIDVALAVDADGVHVGQHDLNAKQVREKLGCGKIIGVSAATVEEAVTAQENGADYLGIGAVFHTSTKEDAKDIPFEEIQKICNAVKIPTVGIGGVNETSMPKLKGCGLDGAAVISAIFAQEDVGEATRKLVQLSKTIF